MIRPALLIEDKEEATGMTRRNNLGIIPTGVQTPPFINHDFYLPQA